MPPEFVAGSPVLEALWAVGIVLVFALGAWLIFLGMRLFHNRLKNKDRETLASQLLGSLYRPVVLLVMLQGIILALSSVTYLETWQPTLVKVNIAVVIVGESIESVEKVLSTISKRVGKEHEDVVLEITKDKVDRIRDAFRITTVELEAVLKNNNDTDALVNLVIERMALLPTQL